jgi:hypothetical protein
MNKRIQKAMEELKAALEEEEKGEQFGTEDDFSTGMILTWRRNYHDSGTTYTFAAVFARKRWYISGSTRTLTHKQLIDEHLIHAFEECGEPELVTRGTSLRSWIKSHRTL